MSDDYKWDMQVIAEELAEQRYGKDFYELSPDLQYETFNDAMHEYAERACDRADYLRTAQREGAL